MNYEERLIAIKSINEKLYNKIQLKTIFDKELKLLIKRINKRDLILFARVYPDINDYRLMLYNTIQQERIMKMNNYMKHHHKEIYKNS